MEKNPSLTTIIFWLLTRTVFIGGPLYVLFSIDQYLKTKGQPDFLIYLNYFTICYFSILSLRALFSLKHLLKPYLGVLTIGMMHLLIENLKTDFHYPLPYFVEQAAMASSVFCALYLFFHDFLSFLSFLGNELYLIFNPQKISYFKREHYENTKASGDHLEKYVCSIYKTLYGNAVTTDELKKRGEIKNWGGDGGIDVIVNLPDDGKLAIQCKNYIEPVGNKVIGEILQGWGNFKATELAIVSPSGFTPQCIEYAKKSESFHNIKIHLIDELSLRRLADKANQKLKAA